MQTKQANTHPLIGAGVHYKDEKGAVQNQATIVEVIPSGCATAGDLVLLQYFEWFAVARQRAA